VIPAVVAAVLLAIVMVPWVVPRPERPSAVVLLRPRGRDHPELIWYFFRHSIASGQALLPILLGVAVGSAAGVIAGTASGFFRLHLIGRSVDTVAVFPSVLLLVVISGFTAVLGLPMLLVVGIAAFVRFFFWAERRASELQTAKFVHYGRSIGEGGGELTLRHVLRNVTAGAGSHLIRLFSDMIVLTANLTFIRLTPFYTAPDDRPLTLIERVTAALPSDWGSALAAAKGDFTHRTYLPAIWPAIFLIATITILRLLGRQMEKRERLP
jgi:ABC-type dipeptide/oligopeptide/nickel transport system permease subunit